MSELIKSYSTTVIDEPTHIHGYILDSHANYHSKTPPSIRQNRKKYNITVLPFPTGRRRVKNEVSISWLSSNYVKSMNQRNGNFVKAWLLLNSTIINCIYNSCYKNTDHDELDIRSSLDSIFSILSMVVLMTKTHKNTQRELFYFVDYNTTPSPGRTWSSY